MSPEEQNYPQLRTTGLHHENHWAVAPSPCLHQMRNSPHSLGPQAVRTTSRIFISKSYAMFACGSKKLGSFLKNIFYWLCYYSCPNFSPFSSLHLVPSFPPAILPLSSCPWVVHISSLATPFPILFLTSPVYFVPTNLYFLIPAPFPQFFPFPFLISLISADVPPTDLYIYDSVLVLLICLVCFLRFSCW